MSVPSPADPYQQAILARAKDAAGAGELAAPDARVTVDNPVCGDRVTMDVHVVDDTVAQLAHRVRGCVLCEAAASVIGTHAPGSSHSEIAAVRSALKAMLDGFAEAPEGKWAELEIFAPVAAHRHRHHCVLLPFEALHRALDAASSGT